MPPRSCRQPRKWQPRRHSSTLAPTLPPSVALAKSLINRPELLLLDEPTASLDPDTGDLVRSWLERYRGESGCTILLASHNMAEVERLGIADNTLVILSSDNGPVLNDGYADGAVEMLGAHRPGGPLRGGKYSGSMSYDDVLRIVSGARGEDPFGYRSELVQLVRQAKSAPSMASLGR